MINANIVYKIKVTDLSPNKDTKNNYSFDGWVLKVNVMPHVGGSGKTFTSKKLVEKNLAHIKSLNGYGKSFSAEIKAFELKEIPYT